MNRKLQVFISSTYTDLIEERQAAVDAILQAGHIPAGMELFSAGNESQLQTIYKWINESDVYMLILGGRYGSIEPKSRKSYTQLEYEYAQSKNIPTFAVVLSESYLAHKVNFLGLSNTIEQNDKYKKFKKLVKSKLVKTINDCKDIKNTIHQTLNELDKQYQFIGWIQNNKRSFASSEAMDFYILERIATAQKSIYHLSWQDISRRPNPIEYENFHDNLIKVVEEKIKQGIFYKDIFTFPYKREERINKIKALKQYRNYWCGYFESNNNTQIFPKLHFLIIDNAEVIFASYEYRDNYCSVFDKEIANIMLSYFEQSWKMCNIIKDNEFHQEVFNAAISDCNTL